MTAQSVIAQIKYIHQVSRKIADLIVLFKFQRQMTDILLIRGFIVVRIDNIQYLPQGS